MLRDDSASASMIGRQLGRYTCLHQLGAGGMAVLYLARRSGAKGFTKVFAVKRVKPKFAADPNFTFMFMTEAKLSASLDHPNIAQVVDFGQDGLEHFLVMEYVHGPDLRRLLRLSPDGRLPLDCAIAILTRVCAALHYAHDMTDEQGQPLGLVHRDVSPTNVLLSMNGAVKLTDFGIAKAFGTKMSETSSGSLAGKPGYMSPEQVRCEPLDRRSDVFSLGILLYEMTTGHRAFFGDNVFEILNASQLASYTPPSEHVPDYPPALAAIVERALTADAADRYASGRELQQVLEEFALDNRLRVSDAVVGDYLSTLDISLTDPNDTALPAVPSGTELRHGAGTGFMLSADATVLSAAPPLAKPVMAPLEAEDGAPGAARSRAGLWIGGGIAAALVAGLVLNVPTADPDAASTAAKTVPAAAVEDDPAPAVVVEAPRAAPEPSVPETVPAPAPAEAEPTTAAPESPPP
ncbi:MAG: protein kinase, partial [Myxococcota bacterium]